VVSIQGNICKHSAVTLKASCQSSSCAFLSDVLQTLRMDGVTFTGDVSIMTKIMSISSWLLERSSDEDLQLQTKETLEGFRVATRGLLTIPSRDGAEACRAVYCMEFEMQASFLKYLCCMHFQLRLMTPFFSTAPVPNASLLLLKRCALIPQALPFFIYFRAVVGCASKTFCCMQFIALNSVEQITLRRA
jgi:hypothetical protein